MKVYLREKKQKSGTISLYLDYYLNKKRKYEFLGLILVPKPNAKQRKENKTNRNLAEQIRAQRQIELQTGTLGIIPNFKKTANYVEYFSSLVEHRRKTGVNFESWRSTFSHLKKYTDGSLRFEELDEQWLENFKAYLLSEVAQNSAHTYFNKIKASLHQAVRDKIISANPAERVRSPKQVDTHREFLTEAELKKIAQTECRSQVLKNAFLFSALTGMRWGDIQKLKWINVRENDAGNHIIQFSQKKTKNAERLPITTQAYQLMGTQGEYDEKVFKGLKYSMYMNVTLAQWVLKAGISKHITFHCARHTYATLLLTKGADIYTVSKLLGHRELRTTQIYSKVIDQKKEEAVDLLPELEI